MKVNPPPTMASKASTITMTIKGLDDDEPASKASWYTSALISGLVTTDSVPSAKVYFTFTSVTDSSIGMNVDNAPEIGLHVPSVVCTATDETEPLFVNDDTTLAGISRTVWFCSTTMGAPGVFSRANSRSSTRAGSDAATGCTSLLGVTSVVGTAITDH